MRLKRVPVSELTKGEQFSLSHDADEVYTFLYTRSGKGEALIEAQRSDGAVGTLRVAVVYKVVGVKK